MAPQTSNLVQNGCKNIKFNKLNIYNNVLYPRWQTEVVDYLCHLQTTCCLIDDFKPSYINALLLPIIIMGDLNCNLIKPFYPEAKAINDVCNELKLTQMITNYW